jgi:tRNA threonylcarbamoyladenosine biosynthesis protein TsaE
MTLQFQSLNELDAVSRQLLDEAGTQRIWLFEGEMGAGKTTLIKALCRAVGVVSVVQSPTFGLINEYTTQTGEPVYHFDCYRLRNEAEALDIGVEEYFDSGHYCFVEWPEKIGALWPSTFYQINLSANATGKRTVETRVGG